MLMGNSSNNALSLNEMKKYNSIDEQAIKLNLFKPSHKLEKHG